MCVGVCVGGAEVGGRGYVCVCVCACVLCDWCVIVGEFVRLWVRVCERVYTCVCVCVRVVCGVCVACERVCFYV